MTRLMNVLKNLVRVTLIEQQNVNSQNANGPGTLDDEPFMGIEELEPEIDPQMCLMNDLSGGFDVVVDQLKLAVEYEPKSSLIRYVQESPSVKELLWQAASLASAIRTARNPYRNDSAG